MCHTKLHTWKTSIHSYLLDTSQITEQSKALKTSHKVDAAFSCVADILVSTCHICWKANKQQLQGDLSSEFQSYTLFSETFCQNDFEHYLTHTAEPVASSKWLGSMLRREGAATKSPLLQQKSFSCCVQAPDVWLVGLHTAFMLLLTLPAVETLSWLRRWRKCRPYKFSHV